MKQPIPFGKYFLLERINVGGMAEVFKAKATGVEGFERLVAVKRILPSIAEDEEFITMFVDEAKIAVQLTHANIAQIFDLGRVEGSFFIALEYVHGKDLRAIFNRTRQRGELLPIPMACYAIMKLCEGLDYAHNKRDANADLLKLVHRDVSPQNILVSYEGEVKIIDFGIAKAAGKAGRTQAGILKGKFGYMSPEQVEGMEIDRRSDVFGVGICLYELLTGERLFVAESDFATLEKVRSVDVMPPSTYNRRIPEELEQIALRALARDRDQRYQTAIQLHDELQSFMHTSGNLFSRKDLGMFMHRMFAEEIEKESARDQEYAQLGTPEFVTEPSGLEVFDEVDPVSSVSALHAQPAELPLPAAPSVRRGRQHKATLLGIPQVVARPTGQASVAIPHLVPRLSGGAPLGADGGLGSDYAAELDPDLAPLPGHDPGDDPPYDGVTPVPGSRPLTADWSGIREEADWDASEPAGPARMGVAAESAGIEWDDEELSTQIYDKPDEASRSGSFQESVGLPEELPSPQYVAVAKPRPLRPTPTETSPRRSVAQRALDSDSPSWATEIQPKPNPLSIVLLVLVGMVATIVLGMMLFNRGEPGSVRFATSPGRVSVSVDGKILSNNASPFALDQLEPNRPHTIVVTEPGYKPWTTQVDLKSGQTLQLPTVTLEQLESGFAVDSEPSGASVLVDGKKLGETPARLIHLPIGEHRLRLEREGFVPWESVLHVSAGTVLPLQTVHLQPLPVAPPGRRARAAASSGGAASGEGTLRDRPEGSEEAASASADPEPESAKSRAALPVGEPEPAAAPVAEPDPTAAPAAPAGEAGPGTLRINSRPWSQVFVDGQLVGVTPQRAIPLPAGRHSVVLVNQEFGIRKQIEVEIRSGEINTQVLNLEPE